MNEQIKEILKFQIPAFLKNMGHSEAAAVKEFEDFYTQLEPEIAAQLASAANGDQISEMNLEVLRDRLLVMAGSAGLGVLQEERQAVTAIVISVLQTAITLA